LYRRLGGPQGLDTEDRGKILSQKIVFEDRKAVENVMLK
jgi:hypothetical protein